MRDVIFRILQGLLWVILVFSLLVIGDNVGGWNSSDRSDLRILQNAIATGTAIVCATVTIAGLATLYQPRP